MKASEYIIKHGIKSARNILKNAPKNATTYNVDQNAYGMLKLHKHPRNIHLTNLSKAIKAFDWIDKNGGIESLNFYENLLKTKQDHQYLVGATGQILLRKNIESNLIILRACTN